MIRAGVVGASGYIGGELLRLLLGHPAVEVVTATSRRLAGRRVDERHPQLRSATNLLFRAPGELDRYDVLFVAGAHRQTMHMMPGLLEHADTVIDMSGDFRLRDPQVYERYYGVPHAATDLLGTFVPGIPEQHRDELRGAERISVPGCIANATILALLPVVRAGLIAGTIVVDARTGSSGSGSAAGSENLHAERSRAMRVYAPVGHRHEAEAEQVLGMTARIAATGIEAVRGVQVLCRARLADEVGDREVRGAYWQHYDQEPFIRIVARSRGRYRLPEPKVLCGSNFCDVGFALDPESGTGLFIGALDNLVKGGSGNAVQCMNIRFSLPERQGLEFIGLHPN